MAEHVMLLSVFFTFFFVSFFMDSNLRIDESPRKKLEGHTEKVGSMVLFHR